MKTIIAIVICLFLVGCASYQALYDTNGQLKEKTSNYTITEEKTYQEGKIASSKTTKVPFVPDRWYSDALDKLGPMISQFSPLIGQLLAYLEKKNTPIVPPAPAPVPAPVTPVPVPVTPYPAPGPTPTPVPGPTPPPIASSVFSVQGNTITLDMNTLPGSMRAAGFGGTDGGLFYALAHIYKYGPGVNMVTHPELNELNTKKDAIYNWFDGEVQKVINTMTTNTALTFTAITNDQKPPDKLGFRLGPPIMTRIINAGIAPSRVTLGSVVPESEY